MIRPLFSTYDSHLGVVWNNPYLYKNNRKNKVYININMYFFILGENESLYILASTIQNYCIHT